MTSIQIIASCFECQSAVFIWTTNQKSELKFEKWPIVGDRVHDNPSMLFFPEVLHHCFQARECDLKSTVPEFDTFGKGCRLDFRMSSSAELLEEAVFRSKLVTSWNLAKDSGSSPQNFKILIFRADSIPVRTSAVSKCCQICQNLTLLQSRWLRL
jgi:hypothetical protein